MTCQFLDPQKLLSSAFVRAPKGSCPQQGRVKSMDTSNPGADTGSEAPLMPLLEWARAWLVLCVEGKVVKSVLRCPWESNPSKLGRGEEAVKEGFLDRASPLPSASAAKRLRRWCLNSWEKSSLLYRFLNSKCNGYFLYGQESKPAASYIQKVSSCARKGRCPPNAEDTRK